MTNTGRGPRLAQKAKPRRFITKISLADDLQCHGTVKIDVECFVSDSHRTATQLDRLAVLVRHEFVMFKSLGPEIWGGFNRTLRRGTLVGFNPTSESLAKHACRAPLPGCRELHAAVRAAAFILHVHSPSRPSDA